MQSSWYISCFDFIHKNLTHFVKLNHKRKQFQQQFFSCSDGNKKLQFHDEITRRYFRTIVIGIHVTQALGKKEFTIEIITKVHRE